MKRMQSVSIAALFVLAGTAAGAQAALTLKLSMAAPTVDGIVSAKEYPVAADSAGMQVNLAWTADALYLAVVGQTSGWVAAGLGSRAMDNAVISIGYVAGDKAQLKVQRGAGHTHGDEQGYVPVKFAMKEANGQTALELALKPADFIAKGQKQLDLIVAFGGSDSFVFLHRAKARLSVSLAQ